MPILSILGWNGILLQPYVNHLYDIVAPGYMRSGI